MKVARLARRQVASPPALSALFNVPSVRMCGRSGVREAGAHLSQALEEGLGQPGGGVGGMRF